MNILPKKRWHVRTKDNIARVRKDEAAAREEERKRQEKFKLAESEARVNFLRKRSGLLEKEKHENIAEEQLVNYETCNSQHVNLFLDYKAHIKTTNKELEKEKKEEQEKYEKKIGYLTYLGQDTNEALRLKSWYEITPKRFEVGFGGEKVNEKDQKIKHNHDPLTLINALLAPVQPPTQSTDKRKRSPSISLAQEKVNQTKLPKKLKKEHRKHKKEKHSKRSKERKHKKGKLKEKDILEEQKQKRLKLEQLRMERLRRETAERTRQEALLAPKEPTKPDEISVCSTPKIVQKYNSQFNPELAKQNIN